MKHELFLITSLLIRVALSSELGLKFGVNCQVCNKSSHRQSSKFINVRTKMEIA